MHVKLVFLVACILWPAFARAQNSAEIEATVNMMVRLCLGGGHTEAVSGGAAGGVDLSLRSLDAKGKVQGESKVTKSSAEGLVDGINNAMTQIAANQADKVRTCLKPVRDRVLDVMLPSRTHSAPGGQPAPLPSLNIAGKWESDFFNDPNLSEHPRRRFFFTFKQAGNRLFGEVLDEPHFWDPPITATYGLSGRIEGSNITFEFKTQWSVSGIHRELFYGEVSGDKIKFMYAPESESESLLSAEFVARRVTSATSSHTQ